VRRTVGILLFVVVVGGIVFLFVLPGRTYLSQSRAMSTAERRLSVLAKENRDLTTKASELQSTAYVEQYARQQYGLILPGEHAYAILPPPATTTTTTTTTVPPPVPTTNHAK
jgi:cell division protein FtsB